MATTVVYIYGQSGVGKTKLLRDVFDGCTHGLVRRGNLTLFLWDDAQLVTFSHDTVPRVDWFIVCSNKTPDDVPIHLDHIFCIDSAENLKEARLFLSSIWGSDN